MTWEAPDEFEEYRIVRPLGAGMMGIVFLAHDTLLDRPVAIKFISALEISDSKRARFLTEARAIARLSHPNVVAVYRVGEVRLRPYLVSEYVRGTSLAAMAKPIPWQRALKIGIGLARGLGAAHRRGVLHRDIKPANVMLGDDDEPKLLDFGLAKVLRSSAEPWLADELAPSADTPAGTASPDHELDATLSAASAGEPSRGDPHDRQAPAPESGMNTREGAIIGTPLYLAPERWRGAPASPASDVYALGVVLHELLTGHAPHAGLALPALAARAQTEDLAPIASRVANLPARLAALIDACTDRDPSRRPGSGDALCELLEAVTAQPPPSFDGTRRGPSTFESAGMLGERKVVAVLFSDLRGFGALSESSDAAGAVERLNQYFDPMAEAITSHGGTIDKFIGDAVLAVFGGVIPLANPAEAALDTALAMRVALRELNQRWVEAGLTPLDNGIGIDFGEVLYGSVGGGGRKELTVLGEVVNTVVLLEAATKKLRTPIVVSEALAAALPPERRSALTSLGKVALKGRAQPETVFGAADGAESDEPRPTPAGLRP